MSQDKKREAIIEAALKRFAHFGVAKTTMSEIGNDLAISKASLYYYFPDKINLYAAVINRIADAGEDEYKRRNDASKDPLHRIHAFLENRTDFIIKYYNIIEFLKTRTSVPDELKPVFTQIKERERKKIDEIFNDGKEAGFLEIDNVKRMAELLYDSLDGLRQVELGKNGTIFPEKKQFQSVLRREKELAAIFLRGLTK